MNQAVIKTPVKRTLPSPMLLSFAAMLLVTLVGLAWLGRAMSDPAAMPITKVLVEGEFVHLRPDIIQQAVEESVDGGFFKVDVEAIRQRLLNEPWIRAATIRRVWPQTLHVQVTEQSPAARWGEHALLNDAGDIFVPSSDQIPTGLPKLSGPLGTEISILRRYEQFGATLKTLNLTISEVRLSARHAWELKTADGKTLALGRDQVDRRLQRFVFGYRRGLDDLWAGIGRVDLRYTNGFAVSAQPAHAEAAADQRATIRG